MMQRGFRVRVLCLDFSPSFLFQVPWLIAGSLALYHYNCSIFIHSEGLMNNCNGCASRDYLHDLITKDSPQ